MEENIQINQDFLTWGLKINDTLTTTLTSQIVIVALGVGLICFILSIAYNYLSSGFKKFVSDVDEKFPDYTEIARGIVLLLCIVSYLPIAQATVGFMEAVNKATSINSVEYALAQAQFEKANQVATPDNAKVNPQATKEEEKVTYPAPNTEEGKGSETNGSESSGTSKMVEDIGTLATMLNPTNLVAALIHGIFGMIIGIIKVIVLGVAVIMTKILVIVGPLAFAFSILPVFRKQLEIWFSTLLTTGFTFTTINILNSIMAATTGYIFGQSGSGVLAGTVQRDVLSSEVLALDAIMLVLYCSCFWLTSKFIGKGDAGRVISKLVAASTAIAAMAISGGASAGASASSMQNAAGAAKNIIENDN